jgi:hypothetical protein
MKTWGRSLVNRDMRVDMIVVRTSGHGGVTACIHTPENDITEGQEGIGDTLFEALYNLAENIEEVLSC